MEALSLVVCLLFIIIILLFFKKTKTSKRLPPGPWKLPIIGSVHHLVGPLPHRTLSDLSRKYGPIMYLQLGQIPTVVISSPRLAEKITKTHDLSFADRPEIVSSEIIFYNKSDIAFAPHGDRWRQMRKICVTQLLSNQSVKSFGPIRESEVSGLVKSIRSSLGLPFNLSEKLFSLTSSVVCRAAFGKKLESHDVLIRTIGEALSLMGGFDVADMFPSYKMLHGLSGTKRKLETIHKKMDKVLDNMINERRAEKEAHNSEDGEDLLGALIRLQQSGDLEFPVTDKNIKAVIFEVFVAGLDTVATIIEWAMAEMMKNQKIMVKAQAEVRAHSLKANKSIEEIKTNHLCYLKMVIKESLRLHPPGPLLLPRECRETCEIDGYQIPKKTRVIVNAWAIGRDSTFWEEAETFVPERFSTGEIDYHGMSFEYVPFGAGRRICPGISFGLAIVELVLAQLLYHFDWKLPSGMKVEDLDMTETFGLTSIRKNKLYLTATSYDPNCVIVGQ